MRTATGRRGRRDASGNVALIFGVLGPFLMALAGGAIDLTRVLTVKSKLNDAADAAALAAVAQSSINAAPGGYTNTAALTANARAMFAADIAGADVNLNNLQVDLSRSDMLLSATVSYAGAVNTVFGGMVGLPSIPVSGAGGHISTHGPKSLAPFSFSKAWPSKGSPFGL